MASFLVDSPPPRNLSEPIPCKPPTRHEARSALDDFSLLIRRKGTTSLFDQRDDVKTTVPPEILARGPLAREAYNRALLDGKTHVKRVPVMLIGQGGAGKTSIKKSLKGEVFKPNEPSTNGIDVDPSHFELSTEIWSTKATSQGEDQDVASLYEYHTARQMLRQLKRIPNERIPGQSFAVRESTTKVSQLQKRLVIARGKKEGEKNVSEDPPGNITRLLEKLLKEGDEVEEKHEIDFCFWDFGGQSVFYDTHPLFLASRAIYILAYNLSQGLHEKAIPVEREGTFKRFEDRFCEKTNYDYLDMWMSSVASLCGDREKNPARSVSGELPGRLPPVLLVCTCADKPHGGVKPQRLAREIFGSLQNRPYSDHLHNNYFAVDNTKSGHGNDCPEVGRLKKNLFTIASELPQMKEEIPIRWLRFQKALQRMVSEGHKWIDLDLAQKVAFQGCKINNDQEFRTLLNFLHDQRLLLHVDDTPDLNNMIILDLQWLIDVFKKVITIKPFDSQESEYKNLWKELEREGTLKEKLLEHVWGPLYDERNTCQNLLSMMEKFSLICAWHSSSGRKEYLVPSMLTSQPTKDFSTLLSSLRIPSLCVRFSCGHVPQGFFARLAVHFIQWCAEEWSCEERPQMYKNVVRLFNGCERGCSVILYCHSTYIEVALHRGNLNHAGNGDRILHSRTSDARICRDLRKLLELMLECMPKEFYWLKNVTYELCVLCPVCCSGRARKSCRTHNEETCLQETCLHFLTKSDLNRGQSIVCNKFPLADDNVVQTKQFSPWFSVPDEKPLQVTGDTGAWSLPLVPVREEQPLSIPGGVIESLQSAVSVEDIAIQLQQSLHLDRASLQMPDPYTKQLIRCVSEQAKRADKLDVVKQLRKITPAGTTGPLLPGHLGIQEIPYENLRTLTIHLSGGDEWILFAERLGLTPAEIRFLDIRFRNPCDAVLWHIANQRDVTVGSLYDELVECGMPLVADIL